MSLEVLTSGTASAAVYGTIKITENSHTLELPAKCVKKKNIHLFVVNGFCSIGAAQAVESFRAHSETTDGVAFGSLTLWNHDHTHMLPPATTHGRWYPDTRTIDTANNNIWFPANNTYAYVAW